MMISLAQKIVIWAEAQTYSGRDDRIPIGLIDIIAEARAELEPSANEKATERIEREVGFLFKVYYALNGKKEAPQLLTKAQLAEQWPSVEALLPDPTCFDHQWHLALMIDDERWVVEIEGIASMTLEEMEAQNELSSFRDEEEQSIAEFEAEIDAGYEKIAERARIAEEKRIEEELSPKKRHFAICVVEWKRGRAQPLKVIAIQGTRIAKSFLGIDEAKEEIAKLAALGISAALMEYGQNIYVKLT